MGVYVKAPVLGSVRVTVPFEGPLTIEYVNPYPPYPSSIPLNNPLNDVSSSIVVAPFEPVGQALSEYILQHASQFN